MSHEADIKKMTLDPGCIALAKIVDQLEARLAVCCPPKKGPKGDTPPLESETK